MELIMSSVVSRLWAQTRGLSGESPERQRSKEVSMEGHPKVLYLVHWHTVPETVRFMT